LAIEALEDRNLLSVTPLGGNVLVNTNTVGPQSLVSSGRAIAMDADGDFVVVWTSEPVFGDDQDVYAQRFNAAGVPQGSEFRINTYTTGDQRSVGVAMDADGDFVVVWTSVGRDSNSLPVFVRRYNAAGEAQSPEVRIGATFTNGFLSAQVAMDADGDFLVAWSCILDLNASTDSFAQRFSASGEPQGSFFRVNTYTTGIQRDVAIAVAPEGDFVIAWHSKYQDGDTYGIYAQRYDSTGAAIGSEFQVNQETVGPQSIPSVAIDASGDFAISFQSSPSVGDLSYWAQLYHADGTTRGNNFRVDSATNLFNQLGSVAMDADGDLAFTWRAKTAAGVDIFGRRFDRNGAPLGSEFRVNTYTTGDSPGTAIAMDADGDFGIVWYGPADLDPSEGIFLQLYDESVDASGPVVTGVSVRNNAGSPSLRPLLPDARELSAIPNLVVAFSEDLATAGSGSATNLANWQLTRNNVDITSQVSIAFGHNPATNHYESEITPIAPLGEGTYELKVLSTLQDLGGNRFDGQRTGLAAGSSYTHRFLVAPTVPVGSEFRVNDYSTNDQSSPAIATDAHGNYVVVWASALQDGSSSGIFAQKYTSAGVASGSEFLVNSNTGGNQSEPVVAMDAAGNFVVAWSGSGPGDSTGIMSRRFSADGTALGSDVRANTYTTGTQDAPALAMNALGEYVIAWQSPQNGDGTEIRAKRFNSAGAGLTGDVLINTYTTGNQSAPSVAIDGDNEYVVIWQSAQDSDGLGIYAQRFRLFLEPQGSEFRVNTTTVGAQSRSSIAMDPAGNFIVVWESTGQDGDSEGVFAQRFNYNAELIGSEFRVNSQTASAQRIPSVSMDTDGDFVVTWQSLNQDGNLEGVYAQKYSTNGLSLETEFRVNTYTTGDQANPALAMDSDGDFVVAWESVRQDGSGRGVFAQRFAKAAGLRVIATTPTSSGFVVQFNRAFDASVLNLYDQNSLLGAADFSVVGANVGPVAGSLVVDSAANQVVFVKTGGALVPDSYMLHLESGTDAFKDTTGQLLDGNSDGVPGDDFTGGLIVNSIPAAITLSIPEFTRGPGQAVQVPAASSLGVPIDISSLVGLSKVTFELRYDPNQILITGGALGSQIAGSLGVDTTSPGRALVTVSNTGALSSASGTQVLVYLHATAPPTATYAAVQILDLKNIALFDLVSAPMAVGAIDDDGIHVAAYLGDTNGSQSYNAPDATLMQRLIVGGNTGFVAYPLADPRIVADISSNGLIQANDVTYVQRAIVGFHDPEIPPLGSSGSFGSFGANLTEYVPAATAISTALEGDVDDVDLQIPLQQSSSEEKDLASVAFGVGAENYQPDSISACRPAIREAALDLILSSPRSLSAVIDYLHEDLADEALWSSMPTSLPIVRRTIRQQDSRPSALAEFDLD